MIRHPLFQDTLLAQPLALKQLLEANSEKAEAKADTPLVGPKALRLRAGQTLPGGNQSTLRIAQGALGKEPSSRPRWFERRKLGVDNSVGWGKLYNPTTTPYTLSKFTRCL